jgi:hypothetical protein
MLAIILPLRGTPNPVAGCLEGRDGVRIFSHFVDIFSHFVDIFSHFVDIFSHFVDIFSHLVDI